MSGHLVLPWGRNICALQRKGYERNSVQDACRDGMEGDARSPTKSDWPETSAGSPARRVAKQRVLLTRELIQ